MAEPAALADDPDVIAELRALSDADLAGLADSALAEPARMVLRQRAADRARQRRRNDPIAREWHDAAYQQFIAAEAACNGFLVNAAGRARGIDPWSLWSGPADRAEHWASWELLEFWRSNPRVTITDYRRQVSAAEEAYRNDRDQEEHDWAADHRSARRAGAELVAGDGPGGVRHLAEADSRRDVPGARPARQSGAVRPVGVAVKTTCKHHDRPGNGIPACNDCPDAGKRADSADRLGELRARAQSRRAERAASEVSADMSALGWSGPAQRPALPVASGTVAVPGQRTVVQARPAISGDQTLRYAYSFLRHFAVWPSEHALVTATLWDAQAHARDAAGLPVWPYSPRFLIVGPYGSGKSWIARLVGKLAPNGEMLLEPTKAALIDLIAERRTVVITEADEVFGTAGRNRSLVATLNAGYEPDHAHSRKQGGKAVRIPLYGPAVIDGIDTLIQDTRPDLRTLVSRCIVMHARQAPEGYRAPRFDRQARAVAGQISTRLGQWMAQEVQAGIGDVVPDLPDWLGNRPASLWEPLFSVALAADQGDPDGPWSTACREACLALETAADVTDQGDDIENELDRALAAWS